MSSNTRTIRIVEDMSGYKEETVCINTGTSPQDPFGFDTRLESGHVAIENFHQHIILGQTFPSEMILGRFDVESILAATLFSNPSIVLNGTCHGLIRDYVDVLKWGDIGLAHINRNHANLFLTLDHALNDDHIQTKQDQEHTLKREVNTVDHYITKGQIPPRPDRAELDMICDDGAFVAYRSSEAQLDRIYRQGYLWGMWSETDSDRVVIFKKSELVSSVNLIDMIDRLPGTWSHEGSMIESRDEPSIEMILDELQSSNS